MCGGALSKSLYCGSSFTNSGWCAEAQVFAQETLLRLEILCGVKCGAAEMSFDRRARRQNV
jgi:hypothetical protein